jgi:hypothetical protein
MDGQLGQRFAQTPQAEAEVESHLIEQCTRERLVGKHEYQSYAPDTIIKLNGHAAPLNPF